MDAFLSALTDHVQQLHWTILTDAGRAIQNGAWDDVRGYVGQLQQIKAEYRGEALRVLGLEAPHQLVGDYRHDALMVSAVLRDIEDSADRIDAAWWRNQRGEEQAVFDKIGPAEHVAEWVSKAAAAATWGGPVWAASKLIGLMGAKGDAIGNAAEELKIELRDNLRKLGTGVAVGTAGALVVGAFVLLK